MTPKPHIHPNAPGLYRDNFHVDNWASVRFLASYDTYPVTNVCLLAIWILEVCVTLTSDNYGRTRPIFVAPVANISYIIGVSVPAVIIAWQIFDVKISAVTDVRA